MLRDKEKENERLKEKLNPSKPKVAPKKDINKKDSEKAAVPEVVKPVIMEKSVVVEEQADDF